MAKTDTEVECYHDIDQFKAGVAEWDANGWQIRQIVPVSCSDADNPHFIVVYEKEV